MNTGDDQATETPGAAPDGQAAAAAPHSIGSGGKAPVGEPQVWLTSMGLGLGILMSLLLLGVIVVKGVDVFWPHKVALVTLSEESEGKFGESRVIAGVPMAKVEAGIGSDRHEEVKIFTGNRDTYGLSFKFIKSSDIEGRTFPENIVVAERLEYGPGVFFPVRLDLSDGTAVDAADDGFMEKFRELVSEAEDRRHQIHHLERDKIGSLNREIAQNEKQRRELGRDTRLGADERAAKAARTDAEIAALTSEYETLAAEAAQLRELQNEHTLVYQLATGEEISQPVGEVFDFHLPNQMDITARLGKFASNLWKFVSENPRESNTEGGIFPAIFGTFVMTLLMSVAVTPFGVIAAIYLREYAKQGMLVQCVRISVNNLAGVPSIVFGVFGLGFFIYIVGGWIDGAFFPDEAAAGISVFKTGGIMWASLTLAIMTLPVVIVATEEALAAVPRGVREAALACGASKWQTIQRIVLPSATPGILTGVILAMARGAGEVAPLMLVGVIKSAEKLPIDGVFPFIHPERKFMHLGFHIYDLGFQSPDSEAAIPMVFATTFLLILLVVAMNLAAVLLRNHLRKKYAMASF